MILRSHPDGTVDVCCSRCLRFARDTAERLVEDGWELRADRLTWCLPCARKVREVQPERRAKKRYRR